MGLFAIIYLVADVWKLQKWGMPFLVFGTNALFSYFLAGVWTKMMLYVIKIPTGETKMTFYSWFYEKVCVPVAGNLNGSLMFALIQVLFIWLILFILYRKKVFIRF
jgi:predicted acyltransferase